MSQVIARGALNGAIQPRFVSRTSTIDRDWR